MSLKSKLNDRRFSPISPDGVKNINYEKQKRQEELKRKMESDPDFKFLNNIIFPYIICQLISISVLISSFIFDNNIDKFTNKIRQLFLPLILLYFVCFMISIENPYEKENYIILCMGSMIFQFACLILFFIKSNQYINEYILFLSSMLIELALPIALMITYVIFKMKDTIYNYLKKPILPMKIN